MKRQEFLMRPLSNHSRSGSSTHEIHEKALKKRTWVIAVAPPESGQRILSNAFPFRVFWCVSWAQPLLLRSFMKSNRTIFMTVAIFATGATLAFGQGQQNPPPAAGAPNAPGAAPGGAGGRGGGGGGGGRGGGGTPGLGAPAASLWIPGGAAGALTDVDLTVLTRYDESMEKEVDGQAAATRALAAATFAMPADPAALSAKVKTLADAELALALRRADGFSKLQTDLKITTPQRLQTVIQAISTRGGRAGGLGGGGGGGAPGGRGAAPGAGPGAPPTAPAGN